MAQLLVLSATADSEVLPALGLLSHRVRQIPAEPANLVNAPGHDLIFLDARHDLAGAKSLAKILVATGLSAPLILVVTEGGLTAVNAEWGASDIVVEGAGPAELDARIRLAIGKAKQQEGSDKIHASGVVIDEASYSAKVNGRPLDLTYKEFELLRFLAAMQTEDIRALPVASVKAMTSAQFAALTTAQVAALVSTQVGSLATSRIKALDSAQVGSLSASVTTDTSPPATM